jgi:hypothetical protein
MMMMNRRSAGYTRRIARTLYIEVAQVLRALLLILESGGDVLRFFDQRPRLIRQSGQRLRREGEGRARSARALLDVVEGPIDFFGDRAQLGRVTIPGNANASGSLTDP